MFYNNSDSQFTYLCIKLLNEIKDMLENKCMDIWITKLRSLNLISDVYTESEDYDTTTYFNTETKENSTNYNNNIFMEYMYVLNLDDKIIELSKYHTKLTITFTELEDTNNLYEFDKI